MKIAAICGSLRKNSYNKFALNIAQKYIPSEVDFEIVEIGNLPFFNQELEEKPPESVKIFRNKLETADSLLIVTPEYNYSIPGVLKNAIEWGSRPYGKGVLHKKPLAIMGASSGMIGTARAQYHLRQICVQTDMYPLNKPEVMITFAHKKFDEQGNCIDSHTEEKIKGLVDALTLWTNKFKI